MSESNIENLTPTNAQEKRYKQGKLFKFSRAYKQAGYAALLVILLSLYGLYFCTPTMTTYPKVFTIEEGVSLKQATEMLKNSNIIRSRSIANILVTYSAGDGGVVSGTYILKEPHSVFGVVKKITTGDFGLVPKTIRIVEGSTINEIAALFEDSFNSFNADNFIALLQSRGVEEGFLFPDTYKFLPNAEEDVVVNTLVSTFNERINNSSVIESSVIPLRDVVIMASIIEKEADAGSRQEVSNILWKRLNIDMPLQVDASFVYSVNKSTFQLSLEDLQDESNPYNTYTFKGLPPTAISNPSLAALEAAAQPQETNNLYFLTGNDGEMYYATNFKQHVRNKELYLR